MKRGIACAGSLRRSCVSSRPSRLTMHSALAARRCAGDLHLTRRRPDEPRAVPAVARVGPVPYAVERDALFEVVLDDRGPRRSATGDAEDDSGVLARECEAA